MDPEQPSITGKPEELDTGISDTAEMTSSSNSATETISSATETEPENQNDQEMPNLVVAGTVLSIGMMVLAVFLGWFGFCDTQQPLLSFDFDQVLVPAVVWGIGASVPLFFLPFAILKFDFGPFRGLKRTVDELLVPLFKECTFVEIALLSILAGLSEEMFFRWCLQGGLANVWGENAGVWPGILIAGAIFGLCHYVTLSYALFATMMGIYLGWVMQLSGTYLAPAIAHGLYDLVALSLIVRLARNPEKP